MIASVSALAKSRAAARMAGGDVVYFGFDGKDTGVDADVLQVFGDDETVVPSDDDESGR
jgi:hypothetical protein